MATGNDFQVGATTDPAQPEKCCPGCGHSKYIYSRCGLCGIAVTPAEARPPAVVNAGGNSAPAAAVWRRNGLDVPDSLIAGDPESLRLDYDVHADPAGAFTLTWTGQHGEAEALRMSAVAAGRLSRLLQPWRELAALIYPDEAAQRARDEDSAPNG